MARAIWTGSLSFGLVSIPVKLYPATVQRDVRFHQFQRGTGRRVHYLRTAGEEPERYVDAEADAAETTGTAEPAEHPPPARPGLLAAPNASPEPSDRAPFAPESPDEGLDHRDLVKGYEVAPGRYVMIDPEELRALRPEADHAIQIEDFVHLPDIDPIYFEKSYYLAPQRGVGAERPYALLVRAMERAQKVAIGRFVLRSKEYLTAIRPYGPAIVMETLFYWDEVRPLHEIDNVPADVEVSERELTMARQLIEALATEWEPTRYEDRYRERVQQLIEERAAGLGAIVEEEVEPAPPRVADLMEALKASVEAARRAKQDAAGAESEGPKRRKGRKTG